MAAALPIAVGAVSKAVRALHPTDGHWCINAAGYADMFSTDPRHALRWPCPEIQLLDELDRAAGVQR